MMMVVPGSYYLINISSRLDNFMHYPNFLKNIQIAVYRIKRNIRLDTPDNFQNNLGTAELPPLR